MYTTFYTTIHLYTDIFSARLRKHARIRS